MSNTKEVPIIVGLVGFLISMFIFWFGGADFLERSVGNGLMIFMALVVGLVGYAASRAHMKDLENEEKERNHHYRS